MPRSGRQMPDLYFGRPGALVSMPWPRGNQDSPYDKPTFDFVTGSGQHVVSSMATGSRPYRLNWDALHVDTYDRLNAYWAGHNGPGPWVYIDPSRPNLLQVNVSSATSFLSGISGFLSSGGNHGTLTSNSNPTFIHRPGGYRSLRWQWLVAAATNPTLSTGTGYRRWFGDPVVPGLSYAFSSWVRADGTVDTSITLALRLRWLDAAGAQLSITTGSVVAVGGWTRLSAIGTAPAGAAFVECQWYATGSTITTNGSLYIDEPMLEQDSVVNDWAPGTGLRAVEILGFTERVPFDTRMRLNPSMDLRELAA